MDNLASSQITSDSFTKRHIDRQADIYKYGQTSIYKDILTYLQRKNNNIYWQIDKQTDNITFGRTIRQIVRQKDREIKRQTYRHTCRQAELKRLTDNITDLQDNNY